MRKLTIGLDELRKEQGDIAKIDKVIIGGSDTQEWVPTFSFKSEIKIFYM